MGAGVNQLIRKKIQNYLRQRQHKLPYNDSKSAKYPCFSLKSIRENAMKISPAACLNNCAFHEKNGFGLTLHE
jgi:hypothetical protein